MTNLPDITSDIHTDTPSTLNWVGMEKISIPLSINLKQAKLQICNAKTNVFVSLDDPEAKGIHMSRIYLAINQLASIECNQENINALLDQIIESQAGISQSAKLEFEFELLLKKQALLSNESGFQSHPIIICAEKNTHSYAYEFDLTIAYSSTCPCSASLSRQLYADAIDHQFNGDSIPKKDLLDWMQSQAGSVATPHSQRSYAYIHLDIGDNSWPDLSELITEFERVIGTPVQTAVKRSDEQEFARLNAKNLMFCEDAGRKIKHQLERMTFVKDYHFKIEHQESLHAHNAVVRDRKFP